VPFHVRSRIPGKHELRVIHPRLPKPFYKTFDDPDEVGRVGERALVILEKGELPEWLVRPVSDSAVTVAQAILSYRNIRAVPASTEGLLDTLGAEIGTTLLADISRHFKASSPLTLFSPRCDGGPLRPLRLRDRRIVLMLRVDVGAAQLHGDVALSAAGHDCIAPDLAAQLARLCLGSALRCCGC
jgi:hypothetical protein